MIEVTQEQFFAYMGPRDVYPRNDHPDHAEWETSRRELVGRSYPGYRDPGAPKRWLLTEAAALAAGVLGTVEASDGGPKNG